ncbi:MAG: amino acid adenylation domain-containing protein [Christensenellaceae bacterium]
MKELSQNRILANKTEKPQPKRQLHKYFFERAQSAGDKIALYSVRSGKTSSMTYAALAELALKYASALRNKGARCGGRIAVMLPRSFEQIAAVIGVLAAGCTYVPINVSAPRQRFDSICQDAEIEFAITEKESGIHSSSAAFVHPQDAHSSEPANLILADETTPAYIIFTSGSSGAPKGVVISHDAACNTIDDVNERFSVTDSDVAIGISSLEFDLSVYDIFGLLSVGGSLAVLNEAQIKEPSAWLDILSSLRVTVWNSVPALFSMMLTANGLSPLPLKKVMLSGDWIDTDIPERTKAVASGAHIIAMGGATEASIWSNYFIADDALPSWQSIPYGKPLANQMFRVVDENGNDCDDEVEGELLIGGRGVAMGYTNPELTRKSFFEKDGVRWYRTGDAGKYRQDGNIIFCGRIDSQMKINGYRIEAGEIESVAEQMDGVEKALALSVQSGTGRQLKLGIKTKPCAAVPKLQPALEPDAETVCFRNRERERQAVIAEQFLTDLIIPKPVICKDMELLFQRWTEWLEQRNVIEIDENGIKPGGRMSEVKSTTPPGEDSFAQALYRSMDLFRGILRGERQPIELLNEKTLSPEVLTASAPEAKHVIDYINTILTASNAKNAAIVDARTGEMLSALAKDSQLRFTAFEPSLTMQSALREKCGDLSVNTAPNTAAVNTIQKDYYQQFDAVIMLYSLHRYKQPAREISWLCNLLRQDGVFIVAELPELQPFALVTSMVLEYGFPDLPDGRITPMRSAMEWADIMQQGGCSEIQTKLIDRAYSFVLHGKKSAFSPSFSDIEAHLSAKLAQHMMPSEISAIREIPLTNNGKVDRKTAALWFESSSAAIKGSAPESLEEKELAEIWASFFNTEQIGTENSFFEMGADSLAATRLLVTLREKYGVEVSMRELFDNAELGRMAALIHEKNSVEMEEGEL